MPLIAFSPSSSPSLTNTERERERERYGDGRKKVKGLDYIRVEGKTKETNHFGALNS
jgi:hypothetical protein